MAGPTAEVLNDDLKSLREEFHRLEVAINGDIHRVEVELKGDIRELSTQVKGIITAVKILAVFALVSLISGVWWGATITADVRNLDKRFDKLEASIAKVIEQTKPVAKN